MRLKQQEIQLLKKTLNGLSEDAKLFLFGSRLDDNKRGGDIDLLIVSESLDKNDLRKLRIEFFKVFGEQKLDIILDDGNFTEPFHKIIYEQAIRL